MQWHGGGEGVRWADNDHRWPEQLCEQCELCLGRDSKRAHHSAVQRVLDGIGVRLCEAIQRRVDRRGRRCNVLGQQLACAIHVQRQHIDDFVHIGLIGGELWLCCDRIID